MNDLNVVAMYGRLTADCETKTTDSGVLIASFPVAVNESWRGKTGGLEKWTNFIRLRLFQKQAEALAPYLKKGTPVTVEGRLKQQRWEVNGEKRERLEVVIKHITLMGGKKKAAVEQVLPEPAGDACPAEAEGVQ
ncbi:MAG: single-stranded DNA-binding protein [Treponema sp.]|jgi:single-strand DNA-binding protein|nr:single-stranded DNA-binding protein [Treponema sp.]